MSSTAVAAKTHARSKVSITIGFAAAVALCAASLVSAQGRYWDGQRFTRLEPGMTIPIRVTEPIDTARTDYRVFRGIVDQDVIGDNGRLAIPRASNVELLVRQNRNNQLVLDLESI